MEPPPNPGWFLLFAGTGEKAGEGMQKMLVLSNMDEANQIKLLEHHLEVLRDKRAAKSADEERA